MKTHVLYIQRFDTLESTLDSLDWEQSERILLVLSGRSPQFENQFALMRLLRHSRSLGAHLALVTRNPDTEYLANQLGIPVFRSMRKAQRESWKMIESHAIPERSVNGKHLPELQTRLKQPFAVTRPISPTARIAFFILGVAAVLVIATVLLPGAHIRLVPRTEKQEMVLDVRANPALNAYTIAGGLPVKTYQVTIEGRETLSSSGLVAVPQRAATGEVTFTNLTENAVLIPQGAIVRTVNDPPIRFFTTQGGELPAEAGAQIILAVQALNPGTDGNLPPNSLAVAEGELGLLVSITNPEATSGGVQSQSVAPSESDYEALRVALLDALAQNAIAEVESANLTGDFIASPQPSIIEVLEETFIPASPQPAPELTLNLRVIFEVWVVSSADLQAFANDVLNTELPEGLAPLSNTLQVTHLTTPIENEDGTMLWLLSASREVRTQITEAQVIGLVLGLSPAEASLRLAAAFPLIAPPQIELAPAWWWRLPILPFRVNVVFE